MEYHPSFVYASDMYQEFPAELKAKMKSQRDEYRANRNNNPTSSTSMLDSTRQIQALQAQLDALRGSITAAPPSTIGIDNQTQVSQVSYNPTLMGGRNDQANRHTCVAASWEAMLGTGMLGTPYC
jgi:hypothetical protein